MEHAFRILTVAAALAALPAHAFDHSALDKALKRHVSARGVDYRGLKADKDFAGYLTRIAGADPASLSSANEKLAFWINSYNASCLDGVLKRYPIKSVMDVKGFFDLKEHKVAGKTRSLNEIEHQILRKQFHEPRVHFALNCASRSCPPLRAGAFTADKLSGQLDAQGRAFVNDASRNRFNVGARTAQLSSIFKWYGRDFGSSRQMLSTIARYAPADVAAMLKSGRAKISYLKYDWSLNQS